MYPTPEYNPSTPEYTPSFITTVPELNLVEEKKEENTDIKFLESPASPPPSDVTSHLQTTPMQHTSPAADNLESSEPPQACLYQYT